MNRTAALDPGCSVPSSSASRRCSHQQDGITVREPLQTTFATKSANTGNGSAAFIQMRGIMAQRPYAGEAIGRGIGRRKATRVVSQFDCGDALGRLGKHQYRTPLATISWVLIDGRCYRKRRPIDFEKADLVATCPTLIP